MQKLSQLRRLQAKVLGEKFPGRPETWMFQASLHGRIYGVPENFFRSAFVGIDHNE